MTARREAEARILETTQRLAMASQAARMGIEADFAENGHRALL